MAKVGFPLTTFNDSEGNPLSNGYLLIRLNKDAQAPDDTQIGSQTNSRITLDVDGVITGSPGFWGNATLHPSNTVYLLSAFRANGQRVIDNLPVTVIGGGVVSGFGLAFGSSFGS